MTFSNSKGAPMKQDRVLVIEDHQDTRDLLNIVLSRAGFAVKGVGTLQEARSEIRAEKYDLYILDFNFPDGSGIDFCREIRADDAETPAVIYSGHSLAENQQACMSAGANAYLVKPAEVAELVQTLNNLLGKSSSK
jgi:two-component system OmpR family response regulator